MSIAFEEIRGETHEEFTLTGFNASRVYRCLWGSRFTLATDLLRYGGATYPLYTGANVRAVNVAIRGVGETAETEPVSPIFPDATIVKYTHALLTVTYETVYWENYIPGAGSQDDPGIIIEESLDLASEFIRIPAEFSDGSYLAWSNGEVPTPTFNDVDEDESPGKVIRLSSYVITRFNVPSIPDEIRTLMGTVNLNPIEEITSGFIYEPETLLYAGATPNTSAVPDGTNTWTVTYRFNYRPNGWNKFWRPQTSTWEKPHRLSVNDSDLGGYDTYESADTNLVFARTP